MQKKILISYLFKVENLIEHFTCTKQTQKATIHNIFILWKNSTLSLITQNFKLSYHLSREFNWQWSLIATYLYYTYTNYQTVIAFWLFENENNKVICRLPKKNSLSFYWWWRLSTIHLYSLEKYVFLWNVQFQMMWGVGLGTMLFSTQSIFCYINYRPTKFSSQKYWIYFLKWPSDMFCSWHVII